MSGRDSAALGTVQQRHIQLGGVTLDYILIFARRRSVGLRVDGRGLQVRAPIGLGADALNSALQSKANWILRQLEKRREMADAREKTQRKGVDGDRLSYLGEQVPWVRDPAGPIGSHRLETRVGGMVLHLSTPAAADVEEVRRAVQIWLREQALMHLHQRLDHFSAAMAVQWKQLKLSKARTRWGSANHLGVIRLNWRLIQLAPDLIDYVVVHELAHLRFMHHGPAFWQTVAQVLPDFKALRQRLRSEPLSEWA